MKRYLLLILSSCVWLSLISQSEKEQRIIIPPSPNASSLGIYGSIPVGHYTGVPNINIPLYTVASGDITMPISLSYHASGIKVAQESSWVGLGWALNAGGVITRTVRGYDDFHKGSPEGFVYARELPEEKTDNPESNRSKYKTIYNNLIDTEPDIFYYNFGGYSGRFIFEKDITQVSRKHKAILLDQAPIEIIFEPNRSFGIWTVKTPDGFIYTFSIIEKTAALSGESLIPYGQTLSLRKPYHQVINAWYLSSIKSPQGDKIEFKYNFEYKTSSNAIPPAIRSTPMYSSEISKQVNWKHLSDLAEWIPEEGVHNQSTTETYSDDIHVKEITFNNGKVVFETIDRDDVRKGSPVGKPQRLDKMKVINSANDIIASYEFNSSYRGSTDPLYRRLFLDEIVDQAGSKHTFTYNKTDLPAKTSVAVDHWGYYNGASSNINYNKYIATPSLTIDGKLTEGADRESKEAYAQAGILTKITYPTGGYSEFQYGLNYFHNGMTTEIVNKPRSLSMSRRIEDEKNYTQTFILKGKTTVEFTRVAVTLPRTRTCSEDVYIPDNQKGSDLFFKFEYYDPKEKDYIEKYSHDYSLECSRITNNQYLTSFNLDLAAGEYRISLYVPKSEGVSVSYLIKYQETEMRNSYEDKKGGGLRVNKITTYDGRDYKYTNYQYTQKAGERTVSSGLLMMPIKYTVSRLTPYKDVGKASFGPEEHSGNSNGFSYAPSLLNEIFSTMVYANTILPLGTGAQGNSIGYTQVTESIQSSKGEGKIVYNFYNNTESWGEKWIPALPTTIDPNNGRLSAKRVYNNKDQLLKRESYFFKPAKDEEKIIRALAVMEVPIKPRPKIASFYTIHSNWTYDYKKQITEYDYSTTPAKETITLEEYHYDNPAHKQMTRQTRTNSDGSLTQTKYKYPGDYTTYPYVQLAQDKHILNAPIEIETSLIKGSTTQITHATQNQHTDTYGKPSSIKALEASTPINAGVNYTAQMKEILSIGYDPNLNYKTKLLKGRNGVETHYIWSYNMEYPIAEIKNATESEVHAAISKVFGIDLISLAKKTKPDEIKLQKGNLQKELPKAQVSTFTYKPLVGMLSATDPSGKTVYYEYDSSNRLKRTYFKEKNASGMEVERTIESYEYNYRNK